MIYQLPPPQPKAEPQEQYSFLKAWGYQGSDEGQFNYPSGVAVDSSAKVYVADLNNSRTQKFTNDGDFITIWGSLGNSESQFNIPSGVAVDSSGNVYVVDGNNNQIQVFKQVPTDNNNHLQTLLTNFIRLVWTNQQYYDI